MDKDRGACLSFIITEDNFAMFKKLVVQDKGLLVKEL